MKISTLVDIVHRCEVVQGYTPMKISTLVDTAFLPPLEATAIRL